MHELEAFLSMSSVQGVGETWSRAVFPLREPCAKIWARENNWEHHAVPGSCGLLHGWCAPGKFCNYDAVLLMRLRSALAVHRQVLRCGLHLYFFKNASFLNWIYPHILHVPKVQNTIFSRVIQFSLILQTDFDHCLCSSRGFLNRLCLISQGFGVAAKSTQECRRVDPMSIVVFHQADVGEFIRNEDTLT